MLILEGFWDEVGGAIVDALRSLMLLLCEVIYKLIVFFFDIFMMLGKAEILSEVTLGEFYNRVGLILGLFMIFRVTFSLIQYVMNPDVMADKQKGLFNIVKRLFVVVVLLGITRPLFNFAYDAQTMIIKSNIIPKVITGKNIDSSDSGTNLAWYTFTSFYSFNDVFKDNEIAKQECPEFRDPETESSIIKNDFMLNGGSLKYARNCVNIKIDDEVPGFEERKGKEYLIDFDGSGLLAVVVGGVILYMILMYVIQVGVRVVQLAYLQLIAPIPIIGYLAPKGEDTLNKWFKQCVTTYLDFFIRIAILYFVVFIIELLISNDYSVFTESLGVGDDSGLDMAFINVIMIIALLIFAQKVPKLLKEIFPSLGGGAASFDFGLNAKKNVVDPLKWGYKSTPIGWAPRALGWTGKKAIGAIDRKVHHVPKPRGKFGQYIDKLAPERAKDVAASRQAKIDANLREGRYLHGEQLYDSATYIDEKTGERKFDPYKAFSGPGSSEYITSYNAVKATKKEMKNAETLVNEIDKELTAAYNMAPGVERDKAIELAKRRRDAAVKNYGVYETNYNLAKEQHDGMKKMSKYSKFAKVEDDYKYYTDRHSEFVDIPSANVSSDSQQNTNQQKSDGNNNYGQMTWDDYVIMDDKVSEANMDVANAVGKEPFTEKVTEAREQFQKLDYERDAAAEKLEEQEASNDTNGVTITETVDKKEVSTDNVVDANVSKSELRKVKDRLEKRYRELDRQYRILENKSMNGQPVDTAEFSKIKAERQVISKELEKIYTALNNN